MSRPSEQPTGVVAVITDDAGRVLMNLRDDLPHVSWPGYWSVLGGKIEPGEEPYEAVVREVEEEAGLRLPDLARRFEVFDEAFPARLVVYTGRWNGDADTLTVGEGQALRFMTREEIEQVQVPPHITDAIERCFPA